MEMEIEIKEICFDRNNVTSVFFIKDNEFNFPDSYWTDFSLVILSWWTTELLEQLSGKIEGEYHFMDGPFFMKGIFKKDTVEFLFLERQLKGSKLLKTTVVNMEQFVIEIIRKTNVIIIECLKNNYSSSDLEILKNNYRKLQKSQC